MSVVVNFELITRTFSSNMDSNKAIIGLHGWKGDEFVFEQVAKILKIDDAQWHFPRAPNKTGINLGR